jgi:hypothetical protein
LYVQVVRLILISIRRRGNPRLAREGGERLKILYSWLYITGTRAGKRWETFYQVIQITDTAWDVALGLRVHSLSRHDVSFCTLQEAGVHEV